MKQARSVKFSSEEFVVVMAGANDAYQYEASNFQKLLKPALQSLSPSKIVFCGIPLRRDLPLSHNINEDIMSTNLYIYELSRTMKNICFLDMTAMSDKCFNRFGVHLNSLGKGIVSERICQAIKIFSANKPVVTYDTTSTASEGVITKHPVLDTSFFSNNNKVHVNNMNIIKAISSFRQNASVAFSHSISADFGEERHMSRAVAVGRMFEKPSTSDCVHSHLTYQKEEGRAGIYGLVTKPTYNSKPKR